MKIGDIKVIDNVNYLILDILEKNNNIYVMVTKLNENNEFEDIIIQFEIFVPMTQWIIKDTNLRPFKIMGELQKSLVGKSINGLGKIHGGSFSFNYSTDETSCYKQIFRITTYD